jgi:monoterpene epsilon-lactone hydrolase
MAGEVLAFPQAPEGVEVRHLRAFVAVAEELNFNRAAARLYLSQPALSRQIRALERLLGCELLRRSTHRVELTIAGSALLDRARRLLTDLDEAIATTQSVGGELANRMATMWAPVLEVAHADRDIQEMRVAYETFLAQAPVPEGVDVWPVNAGGVSALALSPSGQREIAVLFLHGGGYSVGSAYGYRPLVGSRAAACE